MNKPVLTIDDLPSPDTKRWMASRKAAVVRAVRSGAISLQDALTKYHLSRREFRMWEEGLDQGGVRGLRVTKYQERRRKLEREK